MKREFKHYYSNTLQRDMNMLVYGHSGTPLLVIPTQDGKCDNWEGFQMPEVIGDYIDNGIIQMFCIDTVDLESWSDTNGDEHHRAWVQEQYFHYVVNEAIPMVMAINGTGKLPIVTGCSLGATHAVILFYRRPDLFSGMIAMSGCYDAGHFYSNWTDSKIYDNSPVHFLEGMPNDHYYIDLYNQKKSVICIGQGAWEDEGIRTSGILKDIFARKGINTWVDFWGYDVNHDWPWWKKQIRYFLPWVLDN